MAPPSKLSVSPLVKVSLDETLTVEGRVQDEAALTADHREGVRAFLEKREPRFEGR